ncbi:MAG: hypothetical protein NEA02_15670 [Thermoanaerobaculia bacterium]|nr:hypothetical protein [Thermoanaerobaculia bacterium]
MKKAKPAPVPPEFAATHAALRKVLDPFAKKKGMTVAKDGPGEFLVLAPPNAKYPQYPKGLWFVCTRVGKAYVSFHLMPIYRCPDLAKLISPALRKRMQGKSCFNFKTPDPPLFKELSALTQAAWERWNKEGLV